MWQRGQCGDCLTGAMVVGLVVAGLHGPVAATDGPSTVAKEQHCVSQAVRAGSNERPPQPRCYASFAQAIRAATHGAVVLKEGATRVTQEQLNDGYAKLRAKNVTFSYAVIGVSYWNLNYTGSTLTHTAAYGCDNRTDKDWQLGYVGSSWNDKISSAQGFSNCLGRYWEHANFAGRGIATNWAYDRYMNDRTSSIYWI
jgi:hypothetical protein